MQKLFSLASHFAYLGFIFNLCVGHGYAASSSEHGNSFTVDAGAYLTNIEQRLNAPAGFANKVSTITGYLRLRPAFSLGKGWHFEPSLGTLIPWQVGADGSTKTYITHFDLALSIPLFSWLKFRTGPGLQWGMLSSSEQNIDLNNGTSTSTFYTPGYTSHYFLITVQGGFIIPFSSHFSLNLEVYSSDVMSKLRRRFDGVATLGWTW